MSTRTFPYWYKLLRHFEKKGYVQNGLTIPFLIGSREIVQPDQRLLTIDEITVSLNNVGCTILKCSMIGEFVIGSLDIDTYKYKELYSNSLENIIVTDNSIGNIKSIEQMADLFKKCYQTKSDNKDYSKDNGEWGYFTKVDIERIMEII